MIKESKGDILSADAEAIVNTVNCVGVMGRGIALQFKKKFPRNFDVYKKACDNGDLKLGEVLVYDTGELYNPRYVINFPTKNHWRAKSHLADIESGLKSLVEEVEKRGITTIAIPPLGCGLGGLAWREVRPAIVSAFEHSAHVTVFLYSPTGAPVASKMARAKKAPSMTVGRAAMVGLMRQYLSAVMDPFVSLLEVHKLMYLLKVTGEPFEKLQFVKGPYGPYSENLRHVLNATEGYFTSGFGDGADAPEKPIELLDGAAARAEEFLKEHDDTRERFDRVSRLISGFETPFGMELLTTVHWVCEQEQARTADEAIRAVHNWNPRKCMFTSAHIELAWNTLEREALLSSN